MCTSTSRCRSISTPASRIYPRSRSTLDLLGISGEIAKCYNFQHPIKRASFPRVRSYLRLWPSSLPLSATARSPRAPGFSARSLRSMLGITLDELHGWRTAFDAYGRDGLRATHRNIIAKEYGSSEGAAMPAPRCRGQAGQPRGRRARRRLSPTAVMASTRHRANRRPRCNMRWAATNRSTTRATWSRRALSPLVFRPPPMSVTSPEVHTARHSSGRAEPCVPSDSYEVNKLGKPPRSCANPNNPSSSGIYYSA